jgi:hypothetical protein
VPGRGDGGEAPHRSDRRGGNGHGSAEAVADQRGGLVQSLEEGHQDLLDVPRHRQLLAALGVRAPVEQEHPVPPRGEPAQQRLVFAEVEDGWRVDQRGDEQDGRAFAAMVAQLGSHPFRDCGHQFARLGPRSLLIGAKALQSPRHAFGVPCSFAAQHLQEQRQRTRPVLRRGKLWC